MVAYMAQPKKRRQCWRTIEYPKNAFAVLLPIYYEDQLIDLTPLHLIVRSLDEITDYIDATNDHFSENSELYCSDEVMVVPLTLSRLYTLNPGHWAEPEIEFSLDSRKGMFLSMLERPQFYQMLVTFSRIVPDSDPELLAAAPFSTARNEDIDIFIQKSDWAVDISAKQAAIYTVHPPFDYQWRTGQVTTNQEKMVH